MHSGLQAQIIINDPDTCMCFTPAEVRKSDKIRDERNYLRDQNKDLQNKVDTLKLYVQDLKALDAEKNKKIISLNDFIDMQSKHIIEVENKPTQTIVEKRPWYEIPVYTTAGITLGILLKILVIK
jgi:ElaB/YqjD/DUF883 family membrane-anchored ribosome-binding protein